MVGWCVLELREDGVSYSRGRMVSDIHIWHGECTSAHKSEAFVIVANL